MLSATQTTTPLTASSVTPPWLWTAAPTLKTTAWLEALGRGSGKRRRKDPPDTTVTWKMSPTAWLPRRHWWTATPRPRDSTAWARRTRSWQETSPRWPHLGLAAAPAAPWSSWAELRVPSPAPAQAGLPGSPRYAALLIANSCASPRRPSEIAP